ncbi:hypothetical protein GCM10010174_40490 [Kutzneria viridogrisea]|uniref:DUF8129 domain-containing protein n=2 Tax=Kutzneria TaxID=43356 RepID=W5W738_9PSEU|nr:hypothetical protein [Kutzneria albida]AHH96697.1 hypothetical protein KALB_3330 [Kutzneria albida DSM 43870]MBA8928082.1 hypothetical protein [Kutzneria viridogrisea]
MRSSSSALPLPEYDSLALSELAVKIQCLTAHELHQLLGYEWVHKQREDFIGLLTARLKELASGVAPSGTPVVFIPEQATSPENDPDATVSRDTEGTAGPCPTL